MSGVRITTIEICRTCDQPFCAECDEDAMQCADGGWHCGGCSWRDCGRCRDEAVLEQRADIAADLAMERCE